MTLQAAPYFDDVASGPENGAAYWTTTADDVRIRVGAWPLDGARGTVLLMPGRTEYIEKYGITAGELAQHGYATIAVDWRGQGLADRLSRDPMTGHVRQFTDYQHDVAATVDIMHALDMPQPWHLVAHSMGGAIGLRALLEGLPVNSAAFTGPMWGILFSPGMRQLAWGLYFASGLTGQGHRIPPTASRENYITSSEFAGNTLTNHEPMWDYMKTQLTEHPELSLGGPSLRWLGEALRECKYLMQAIAPPLPALCFAGDDEVIVDSDAMRQRMENWPDGDLRPIPGAQHEILMEGPEIRSSVLAEMIELFARGDAQAGIARAG